MTDCIFDSTDPVLGVIAQELASFSQTASTTHVDPISIQSSNSNGNSKASTFEFRLDSFLTRARPCQKLFPSHVQKQRYEKVTVQERLIMLSVADKTSKKEQDEKENKNNGNSENTNAGTSLLVAGIEVLEYTLYPHPSSATETSPTSTSKKVERIVYVAKVDTSGYWPPPPLVDGDYGVDVKKVKSPTQSLVRGYLKAVKDGRLNSNNDGSKDVRVATSKTSLFVFARAQPQYLFANSADNENKRVLDDRGLVRWWKNMLGSVFDSSSTTTTTTTSTGPLPSSSSSTMNAYWFIPGVDSERQAMGVIRQPYHPPKSPQAGGFSWTYGYPDKESTQKANTLIPKFPDDPKSRMMRSASCQNGNVDIRTFWELTAIGEESGAGKITGFFRVLMEADIDPGAGSEEQSATFTTPSATKTTTEIRAGSVPESVLAVAGSEGQYTKMFNFLLGLDFKTLEQAQTSTAQWKSQIQTWTRVPLTADPSPAEGDKAQEEQGEEKEQGTSAIANPNSTLQQQYQRRLWIQVKTLEVELPLKESSTDPQSSNPQAAGLASAGASAPVVHVLGAGMIKRKPLTVEPSSGAAAPAVVNVLGAGLIRRKSPTNAPSVVDSSAAPAVNVLGASFIKKRKIDP